MVAWLLVGGVVVIGGAIAAVTAPDIARYLKMRRM